MRKKNTNFLISLTMIIAMAVAVTTAASPGNTAGQEMPQSLWQAFDDARHQVEPVENDQTEQTYWASNYGNGFSMQFSGQGLTLKQRTQDDPWQLTMRLKAYGQQHPQPVEEATVQVEGRRITYHRGDISEWYVNRNDGLEQGFTLNDKPENYQADQPVQVNLSLDGNVQPRWVEEGQTLGFYDGDQRKVFNYSKLIAHDATGQNLPATMKLADGQIILEVDTADAAWPVTIDPVFYSESKVTGVDSDAGSEEYFGSAVAVDGDTALITASHGDSTGTAYIFVRTLDSWNLQAKLVASDGAANDEFGISVALDGDTALIGAWTYDNSGAVDSGSAYVFVRSGDTWTEEAKLIASNYEAWDRFGSSVALSGDTALVGSYKGDSATQNTGTAYVFIRSGTTWSEQAILSASDAAVDDFFGIAVAINGDIAVVGAYKDDTTLTDAGSAYVFTRSGTSWTQQQKLTPSDAALTDHFGRSVALSGNTALIGAYKDDTPTIDAGSAYVFVESGGVWSQQAKLVAGDATASEYFGTVVALDGDTALVSADRHDDVPDDSGAAYVFTRSGTTWTQQQKLNAGDAAANDEFGFSVALSGDTLLVGAHFNDDEYNNAGSAYVFTYDSSTWSQEEKFTAVKNQDNRAFGQVVSIDGDTALIGAAGDRDYGSFSGAAFIFLRSADRWVQTAKLTASDGSANDSFGESVALSGDTAIIGAYGAAGDPATSGAAYVFVKPASGWVSGNETAKLTTSNSAASDFGRDVAISGDTVIVGDYGDSSNKGAAYVFVKPASAGGWSDFVTGTDFEVAELTASDGAPDDRFGWSLAISGDTALIGARDDGHSAVAAGSAYVFVEPASGWASGTETAKLTASDAAFDDEFGDSVAISDDIALVGSSRDDDVGSAYVFVKPEGGWSVFTTGVDFETAKLTASDALVDNRFGAAVAISDDTVLIGDRADSSSAGATYVYVKAAGGWVSDTERVKLTASDGRSSDQFGTGIAISGDTVLSGAPADDDGGTLSGSAYFYRFECGFSGSVAAGRWTMFGVPCYLGSANTVADVLGDDLNSADYGYTWSVYKRDEASERYVRLGLSSPLELGEGYWIMSYAGGYWDVDSGVLTTFIEGLPCASPRGCYEIELVPPADASSTRYNMVGNPGNIQADWAGVTFLIDGVPYTPFDAEFNNFVANTMWKYNGNGYDSYNDATPGMIGYLDPYDGFWVQVLGGSFGKPVKMLVPYGTSTGSPPGPPGASLLPHPQGVLAPEKPFWASLLDFLVPDAHAAKPDWQQEWYVRLIAVAEDGNLVDQNNVLGQLQESMDIYDRHDLVELDPFAAPYLSLSFPHHDWGDRAGDYTSDYHLVNTAAADEWVFEVHSDDAYRNIDLYWDGLYLLEGTWTQDTGKKTWTQSKVMDESVLYKRMVLEDLDLGVAIPAVQDGVVNNYSFNMNGQNVRSFRWVMKSKNGKTPKVKRSKPAKAKFTGSETDDPMEQVPLPGKKDG